MVPSVPKRFIEALSPVWRMTRRCLGVSTGKVVLPLRKGAIVIDLYQVRAVFRNTDAIAYVDSGDQGDDEDLAARWSLSVWWRFEHSVIVSLIKS